MSRYAVRSEPIVKATTPNCAIWWVCWCLTNPVYNYNEAVIPHGKRTYRCWSLSFRQKWSS